MVDQASDEASQENMAKYECRVDQALPGHVWHRPHSVWQIT